MKKLILHCSDSPYDHHGVEAITEWHLARGWRDIGYHVVIERSGALAIGRDIDEQGAHTLGHNKDIGLCVCGLSGKFKDEQIKTLRSFIALLKDDISEVCQHSDFSKSKPHCAGFTDKQLKEFNALL